MIPQRPARARQNIGLLPVPNRRSPPRLGELTTTRIALLLRGRAVRVFFVMARCTVRCCDDAADYLCIFINKNLAPYYFRNTGYKNLLTVGVNLLRVRTEVHCSSPNNLRNTQGALPGKRYESLNTEVQHTGALLWL